MEERFAIFKLKIVYPARTKGETQSPHSRDDQKAAFTLFLKAIPLEICNENYDTLPSFAAIGIHPSKALVIINRTFCWSILRRDRTFRGCRLRMLASFSAFDGHCDAMNGDL